TRGRLRKPDAYPGAAGGVRGRGAADFSAYSGRVGKDGAHAYSPRRGERRCIEGRTARRVETADCNERKDTREEDTFTRRRCAASGSRQTREETKEAMSRRRHARLRPMRLFP